MNPNLNRYAPTGTANQETRTFDWWFAGRWALAGFATATFAVKILTIPRPVAAAVFAVILIAVTGVAVGWIARGRTDGR